MTDKQLVLTTCGSADEARRIAEELVGRRLAACVSIIPQVEAVYRWKGEVEHATEWLLVIKTTANAFESLRDVLSKLHSYDVPECVAITVADGSPAYLQWIANSVAE